MQEGGSYPGGCGRAVTQMQATRLQGVGWTRKVDIRLPGEGSSNYHGARPVCKNLLDDEVASDQQVVNKELSPWRGISPINPGCRVPGLGCRV